MALIGWRIPSSPSQTFVRAVLLANSRQVRRQTRPPLVCLCLPLCSLPLFAFLFAAARQLLAFQSVLFDGSCGNLEAKDEVSEAIFYKLNSSIPSRPARRPRREGRLSIESRNPPVSL
jgi:hypothetical protein